ncbi:hypothetical protein [Halorussus aquaticus]|uniref:Flagellar protein FlaJ n=1 Tax=Halorussus aquaticus TaxID=2953748 RepID=A0ABD5PYY2_9EURY|nr:hypothetical protein [Halorussus aquaticus]
MAEQTRRDASETAETEDERERRTGGVSNWLLVEGDRRVVAGGILAAVLLALVALFWSFGFAAVRSSSPIYFLFSSLVTGDLTLVTVVLSINQLVLSRELGAPGNLSERVQGAVDYRTNVEDAASVAVSPNSPARFLRFLHDEIESRTQRIETMAGDVSDESLRGRIADLTSSLYDDVALVNRTLESSKGVFSALSATIATNHASQLRRIAQIRAECDDSLSEDLGDALDELETQLLQIDVARTYFETVYVQKELAYLSRVMLYVGLPAIVVDGLALVFYNALGPAAVPALVVYAVVAVGFTVGFAPLAILFAFVLRLAWVAQRTATVAPFTPGQYRP